jgi:DNA (cytosine-5)-methyltransferase 1
MIENVKALIQKKFIDDFYGIVSEIESYGYKCYYPTKEDKKNNITPVCLNAKDYGIAQNRERIFVICIRNDIDDGLFNFPQGFDNGLRLKDFLEDTVDEKWYLSEEYNNRFTASLTNEELQNKIPHDGVMEALGTTQPLEAQGTNCRHWVHNTEKLVGALSATDYKQPKQILDTTSNAETKIDEKYYLDKTKTFFIKNSFDMEAKGNGFRFEPHIKNNASISKTITTRAGARMDDNFILDNIDIDEEKFKFDSKNKYIDDVDNVNPSDYKIRKLTPKECWRLMGFRDECFDRVKELGISDSSLYKSAGNSIVVNCLYYIFKELFKKYIVE